MDKTDRGKSSCSRWDNVFEQLRKQPGAQQCSQTGRSLVTGEEGSVEAGALALTGRRGGVAESSSDLARVVRVALCPTRLSFLRSQPRSLQGQGLCPQGVQTVPLGGKASVLGTVGLNQ